MKVDIVAAAVGMASVAIAAPAAVLEERQFFGGGGKFELTKGASCKGTTLIWARGTTEAVNIVRSTFQILMNIKRT
jgi:hypothetical protein